MGTAGVVAMKRFATVDTWCPECGHRERFRVRVPERQAHHALYQQLALGKGQCQRCEKVRQMQECQCALCVRVAENTAPDGNVMA